MYPSDQEAKDLIIRIGRKMYEGGFVSANDGNITMRVEDDAIWATPTGVSKGDLSDDKLIKVRISTGEVLEGTWKPTSELYMHLNVYRTDNEIMSTAHAHPLNMCVFACAGLDLDLPTTPAAVSIGACIPVVPFEISGSEELAKCVIPYVKKYHVINLANHGPLAWGKTPIEAWYRMEDAEASARLALEIFRLGKLRPMSAAQILETYRFHNIDIQPEAYPTMIDETTNQCPGESFTEYIRKSLKI